MGKEDYDEPWLNHGSSSCDEQLTFIIKCCFSTFWSTYASRAAERIVGAQGKYIKSGPYCVKGVGGARPHKILRFYMLASQVPFCACI